MQNITHIVGIDEVGRGPLAGPLTICACKVARGFDFKKFKGIKDSKQLSPQKREKWFIKISSLKTQGELDFALSSVSAEEIDGMGLSWAIKKAISKCLKVLCLLPETVHVKLDGSLKAPKKFIFQETIIKGDEKESIIAAASIIAKVTRDGFMTEQAKIYPVYGFEKHKGYGTSDHFKSIRKFGVSPIHRKSFCGNI